MTEAFPSPASDRCPSCQRPLPAGAAFCPSCGRSQTPGASASSGPVPSPAGVAGASGGSLPSSLPWGVAPAPVAAGTSSRPLTSEEVAVLQRKGSSSGVGIARVIGLIGGLGALALGLGTFVGVAWDWNVFPVELIIVLVLGLGGAGSAYSIRKQVNTVLDSGTVNEVQGALQWGGSAKTPTQEMHVGPTEFVVPSSFAATYRGASALRLTWAPVGKPRRQQLQQIAPVYFLEVNGVALPKILTAYSVEGGGAIRGKK
jgi:hypothetical protein